MSNRPEREKWFTRQALGMFIHWGPEAQMGMCLGHWMVGAEKQLVERYFKEMPALFRPDDFDPRRWALLARTAGMKYVVFTTKHHSGFCMFPTATTEHNVTNTPLGRDVTGEIVEAFRAEGLAVGLYFSPWDFLWEYRNNGEVLFDLGKPPKDEPGLLEYNTAQVRELLDRYGPVDIVFFDDGFAGPLKDVVWRASPQTVITRSEMTTPEQKTSDKPMPPPWEANLSIINSWSYRPRGQTFRTGGELIRTFVQTRALGGNLLINLTPDPHGRIGEDQQRALHELGMWNFVNQQAVYDVEPGGGEGNVWYTKAAGADTVYAVVDGPWPWGYRREITLKNVRPTDRTEVEIVGQSGLRAEHEPDADVKARWKPAAGGGIHVSAVRAFRFYDARDWPNPPAIRITNAEI